ncbi:MAG: TadE family protein [Candidatus Dormibacteria bacterium]
MVEFALVAPIFFFMLFGIMEFGIMMFDVATTRFAAEEAARTEAQVGTGGVSCPSLPGCLAIYPAKTPPADTTCDADCQAIVAVHRTALGGVSLEQVNYVDVQQMQAGASGSFTPVAGKCQRYNFNGSAYSGALGSCSNYPASGRNVQAGQMDYVQVNINFTYNWLTGLFRSIAPSPTLDSKFLVRLEPQKF